MCRAAIDISLLWSERRDNLRRGIHRRGEVTSPDDGLGNPTPTGSTVCDNPYGYHIPHCAPLERGDWMCRAAIDISLLWSERRDNLRRGIHRRGEVSSPAAQRVGEPNPYGFNRCATIPHCAPLERGDWMCRAAIDISLLWSERRDNLRRGIHCGGEVSSPSGLGNPTPTNSTFPVSLRRCTLALKFPSRLAAHRELELVLQQHRVTFPSLPF